MRKEPIETVVFHATIGTVEIPVAYIVAVDLPPFEMPDRESWSIVSQLATRMELDNGKVLWTEGDRLWWKQRPGRRILDTTAERDAADGLRSCLRSTLEAAFK